MTGVTIKNGKPKYICKMLSLKSYDEFHYIKYIYYPNPQMIHIGIV